VETVVKIEQQTIAKTEAAILRVLCYFDIFHYPIIASEILQFNESAISQEEFLNAADRLIQAGALFNFDKFYSLENNLSRVENRILGNERAEKIFPRAKRIGALLFRFPYVRAVAVSGSLSKNFADEEGDIDFFILTKANRLWIARTFMHLFKKLTYLFGMQHSFCMNYYLDETSLEIKEKNIYTATEIKTLLPLAGTKTIQDFFETNDWSDQWLPNFHAEKQGINDNRSMLKRFIEWMLNNKMGDKLDSYFFSVTTNRWLRKELAGRKNIKGRTMSLLTGKHFARSNPGYYQEKILEQYHSKLAAMKTKWPEFF
jgi:nucleotidyltransferase-like protein